MPGARPADCPGRNKYPISGCAQGPLKWTSCGTIPSAADAYVGKIRPTLNDSITSYLNGSLHRVRSSGSEIARDHYRCGIRRISLPALHLAPGFQHELVHDPEDLLV